MSQHKKHTHPVPPGNQPQVGPPDVSGEVARDVHQAGGGGAGLQEQDPKRRLGDFTGKGGHSIQEPGGLNGADH